jgi:oxygen-independent coproporphyrinogen-3 oxidase
MDDATVGVYLHVPFCERICPYCDFAVVRAPTLAPEVERRYLEALLRELEARRGAFAGRRLESLYLGGGTPSLLAPDSVARLVAAVRTAFPGPAPVEVTLEANPGSLERERLPGFRSAGVDRISVGIQSFDDATLRRLGRAHRGEEGRRTLRACREAAFEALSLDLILAAPGQTPELLAADLEQALAFEPEHVSAYELTIEAGTPFALARRRGQLRLPDEEAAIRLLAQAERALEGAGLRRYEISSYARPGREAVHNRRYWQRRPVLGLGVGAVSSDPPGPGQPFGARRSNPCDLEAWLAGEGAQVEVLGAESARGEAVFLGLRQLAGLEAAPFAAEFGAPPRAFFAAPIAELVGAGLLAESPAGDLALTSRGRLLSDSVFTCFV